MSKLAIVRAVVEIAKVAAETFGIVEERALARRDQERDAKIAHLERQLEALQEKKDPKP